MNEKGPDNKIFGVTNGENVYDVDGFFYQTTDANGLPKESDLDDMFARARGDTPSNGAKPIDTEPIDAAELARRMDAAHNEHPTETMSEAEIAKALSEADRARFEEAAFKPTANEVRKRSQTPAYQTAPTTILTNTAPNNNITNGPVNPELILQTLDPDEKPFFTPEEEAALYAAAEAAEAAETAETLTVEEQLKRAEGKVTANDDVPEPYPKTRNTLLESPQDINAIDTMLANGLGEELGDLAIGLDSATDASIQRPAAAFEEKPFPSNPNLASSKPEPTVAIPYKRLPTRTQGYGIQEFPKGDGTPQKGLKAVTKTTNADFEDPWAEAPAGNIFANGAAKSGQRFEIIDAETKKQLAIDGFNDLLNVQNKAFDNFKRVKAYVDMMVHDAESAGVDDSTIISTLRGLLEEKIENKHVHKAISDKLREFGVIVKAPGFWKRNWKKASAAVAMIGLATGLGVWQVSKNKEESNENDASIEVLNSKLEEANEKAEETVDSAEDHFEDTEDAFANLIDKTTPQNNAEDLLAELEDAADTNSWADVFAGAKGAAASSALSGTESVKPPIDIYLETEIIDVAPGIGKIKTQKEAYTVERGDSYWKIAQKKFPEYMGEYHNGWLPVVATYMANYRNANGDYRKSLDRSLRRGKSLSLPTDDEMQRLVLDPEFRTEARNLIDNYLKNKLAEGEISPNEYIAQLAELEDALRAAIANSEMATIAAELEKDEFDRDELVEEVEFQLNNNVDKYWGYSAAGLVDSLASDLSDTYKQEDEDKRLMPIYVAPVLTTTQQAVEAALAAGNKSIEDDKIAAADSQKSKWSNTEALLAEWDEEEAAVDNEWESMLENWESDQEAQA